MAKFLCCGLNFIPIQAQNRRGRRNEREREREVKRRKIVEKQTYRVTIFKIAIVYRPIAISDNSNSFQMTETVFNFNILLFRFTNSGTLVIASLENDFIRRRANEEKKKIKITKEFENVLLLSIRFAFSFSIAEKMRQKISRNMA